MTIDKQAEIDKKCAEYEERCRREANHIAALEEAGDWINARRVREYYTKRGLGIPAVLNAEVPAMLQRQAD